MRIFMRAALVCATVILAYSGVSASAETKVGSNIDSRVVLAFQVEESKVAEMLPEGWAPLTLPKGPFAGSNLLMMFADRHLAMDPEGKPVPAHSTRFAALLAYGVSPEVKGARMFVTQTYELPPVASAYGNGIAASVDRTFGLEGEGAGPRTQRETWTVAAENGETFNLDLTYERGRMSWSSSEATPYSAANPDFYRIYRYEQMVDLIMSNALERKLNGEISFTASGHSAFDGTEVIQAAIVIPVYVREVSLP